MSFGTIVFFPPWSRKLIKAAPWPTFGCNAPVETRQFTRTTDPVRPLWPAVELHRRSSGATRSDWVGLGASNQIITAYARACLRVCHLCQVRGNTRSQVFLPPPTPPLSEAPSLLPCFDLLPDTKTVRQNISVSTEQKPKAKVSLPENTFSVSFSLLPTMQICLHLSSC